MSRHAPWLFGACLCALGMVACSALLGLEDRTSAADAATDTTHAGDAAPGIDAGGADASDARPGVDAVAPDASDTWTTMAPMGTSRAWLVGAAVNGKGYAVGGVFDGYTNPSYALEVYDPGSDAWVPGAPSPRPLSGAAAAVLGGKIYLFGGRADGVDTAAVSVYAPVGNAWSTAPAVPAPHSFATAVAVGGKAYVIGERPFSGVDIYDPSTGAWTTGAPMPTPRSQASSAAANGAVYVVGGGVGGGVGEYIPTGALEKYDPATNQWTTRAPMPTPRWDATCAEVNGLVYVIGGWVGTGPGNLAPTAAVEAYDPATDTWSRKADMSIPRAELTSFVIDGRIFVAGGRLLGGSLKDLNTLEVYTP